jgi:hypothetical protein
MVICSRNLGLIHTLSHAHAIDLGVNAERSVRFIRSSLQMTDPCEEVNSKDASANEE